MMRLLAILVFSGSMMLTLTSSAQEKTKTNDTWYVWIDTEIQQSGEKVLLLSRTPITITCCVKSAKYRKFVKKTANWIKDNYDTSYDVESASLQKIQDQALAEQMILEKSAAKNVIFADYAGSCK